MRCYENPHASAWYQEILDDPSRFPFAFSYDGARCEGFPPALFELVSRREEQADDRLTAELLWRRDDALYLSLRCAHYPLYGATEWTVRFENRGERDTGVISDAETCLRFPGKYPTLKGILGDHTNWYRPYALDVAALVEEVTKERVAAIAKSVECDLIYFLCAGDAEENAEEEEEADDAEA